MSEPLFDEPDPKITNDLARKIGVDVIDMIIRTLEIAPPGRLPIIASAGVASVSFLAKHLEHDAGIVDGERPLDKSVFIAALIIARLIISRSFPIAMEQAMKDCDLLIKRGRI